MLYIPNAISFPELLEKRGWTATLIKNHGWKFPYVFSKVLNKVIHRGDNEFRQYSIAELDEVLKNSLVAGERVRFSKLVVDYLVKWNVLIRARDYITPRQKPGTTECRTHVFLKLNDLAMVDGFTYWKACSTWKPAPVVFKSKPGQVLTGIYQRLAEQLHRVTVDEPQARQLAEDAHRNRMALPDKKCKRLKSKNNPTGAGYFVKKGRYVNVLVYSCWNAWVDGVVAADFSPVQDALGTGRFYTLLHSSPTHLRMTLLVDGLRVYEADIKNSQPLIFCTLLKEHFGTNLPDKVAEFIRICERGEFYATIRALVLTPDEDALISDKDFKAAFFGKIFYSTEKRNWVWRQKFEAVFKEVSEYITSLKAGSYKDLPAELSRRESRIMLEGVAAKLLDAGASFYTLHDAIYAAAKDLALVEQLIRAEFAAHGVGVTIKLPENLPVATQVPVPPTIAPSIEAKLAAMEAEFELLEAQETDQEAPSEKTASTYLNDEEMLARVDAHEAQMSVAGDDDFWAD